MSEGRISKIFERELERENKVVNLIPSESPLQDFLKPYVGSNIHQKYAEGYPGRRYYNGCKIIDELETAVIEEVAKNFNCKFANVQAHSGSTANQAVYKASGKWFKQRGITGGTTPTLSMSLDSGGHLSHFSVASFGKHESHSFYDVNPDGSIDLVRIEDWLSKHEFGLVVIGASSYPLRMPYGEMSKIFQKYKNFFIVFDVSHIAGLIVGGQHKNPADYDWGEGNTWCMTSTTHKTYGAIRHAIIIWNDESLTKPINHAVFPELQGGANFAIIGALGEWAEYINNHKDEYCFIQSMILSNLQKLIAPLKDKLVFGKSENHLALVRCKSKEHAQKVADKLEESDIIVNVNGMFDGSWGIRIGSTYETLNIGSKVSWEKVGEYIKYVIDNVD